MNQRLFLFIVLIAAMLSVVSCTKDAGLNTTAIAPTVQSTTPTSTLTRNVGINIGDCPIGQELSLDSLPATVGNYLQTNHPTEVVDEVEKYEMDGTITYVIELDEDVQLILDAGGTLLAQGQETDLLIADIPANIQTIVATDYPTDTINEAEKGWNHQGIEIISIELQSGLELQFDQTGALLCTEQETDDDDDKEDDDDKDDLELPSEITALVQDYLTTNFPGYSIKDADLKALCDGTPTIVISLKNAAGESIKAYFAVDLEITLLQTQTKILSTALPTAVTDAIAIAYPTYELDNKAKRIELPDGTIQYKIEVEDKIADKEIDIILSADGTIICTK